MGGAGFIGSHLADALLLKGYDVRIVDDRSTGKRENVNTKLNDWRFKHMSIVSSDFNEYLKSEQFDFIFHLAAQTSVSNSISAPADDLDTNVRGTIELLRTISMFSPRTRIIYSATGGAIYGPDVVARGVYETHYKEPQSPYGISKLTAEQYINFYAKTRNISAVTLRYSNVYGPRQNASAEGGVIAIFCRNTIIEDSLIIYGDGEQSRDFVYVSDVVDANIAAMTVPIRFSRNIDDNAYNIGTDVSTSIKRLAYDIRFVAISGVGIEYMAARIGEVRTSQLNITKAKEHLWWSPAHPLKEGLTKTINWFNAQ